MEEEKKGWSYIVAIFEQLLEKTKEDNIIEPHYMYRGITKRYFSRSEEIETYFKEKKEDPSKSPKEFYEEQYHQLLNQWEKENTKYTPQKALKILVELSQYKYILPEYIKSGVAVRLQEHAVSNTPHVDYVNYIKHMINDIRERFPKYVDEEYSDLEILADIQHKGAASCLVDFSNNFLTSLWFATNEDYNDFGFLFCYDINKSAIENDRLSILDPKRCSNSSITDLLYETTKTIKCTGKQTYRFWLWKPSNLNERIARQDSMFVLGLEAFKVKEHEIKTIPIPPNWKRPIQHALKSFFGITAENIYCDIDGYAGANAKSKPYEKTILHYFNENYCRNNFSVNNSISNLQNGLSCLYQCEYELALKYLNLYESKREPFKFDSIIDNNQNIQSSELMSLALEVELHYSKGRCMKNLNEPYGAICEFKIVLEHLKKIDESIQCISKKKRQKISRSNLSHINKFRNYFVNKHQKSVDDIINLYYDTKQFDKIICMYDKKNLPRRERNNFLSLWSTIAHEVLCLKAFETYIEKSKNHDTGKDEEVAELRKVYKELLNYDIEKGTQPLFFVLNRYFDSVREILNPEKFGNKNLSQFDEIIDSFDETFNSPQNFYISWNMRDIKTYINKIEKIDKTKYIKIMEITAKMCNFTDYIQGKANIEPW